LLLATLSSGASGAAFLSQHADQQSWLRHQKAPSSGNVSSAFVGGGQAAAPAGQSFAPAPAPMPSPMTAQPIIQATRINPAARAPSSNPSLRTATAAKESLQGASAVAAKPAGRAATESVAEQTASCFPIACATICSSNAVVKHDAVSTRPLIAAGDLHLSCLSSCERLGGYCCSFCMAGSFGPDLETPAGPTTLQACLETCPEAALGALLADPVRTLDIPEPKQGVVARQQLKNHTLAVPQNGLARSECETWCSTSESQHQHGGDATGAIASCRATCMEMFLQCDTSCMIAFSITSVGPFSRSTCLSQCRDEVHKQVPRA